MENKNISLGLICRAISVVSLVGAMLSEIACRILSHFNILPFLRSTLSVSRGLFLLLLITSLFIIFFQYTKTKKGLVTAIFSVLFLLWVLIFLIGTILLILSLNASIFLPTVSAIGSIAIFLLGMRTLVVSFAASALTAFALIIVKIVFRIINTKKLSESDT